MNRDKAVGIGLLVISIVIILAYIYLTFLTPYSLMVLKITDTLIIIVVFGILAWIGYTLATTPPPKPIEEIEKEIEEELKKLEEESKQEQQRAQ
ncbi:transcriptional regulator [Vulcanisaeta thermophila]|uniref:transcriptional regulator n=1 Tax=Vulcanisaeta thermophila TaxID=867917 RepID=UPI000853AE11|nr:transcriptional regulator [Vulcanisaeta thermophila]